MGYSVGMEFTLAFLPRTPPNHVNEAQLAADAATTPQSCKNLHDLYKHCAGILLLFFLYSFNK